MKRNRRLMAELAAAGAEPEEAAELSVLADQLKHLTREEQPIRKRWWVAFAGGIASTGVVAGLAAVSLVSLPGQPLHGLKTVAEAAVVRIDSATRAQVMMNQSWEIAQLASLHRPDGTILAAVADYNQTFSEVKGEHDAAWAYCAEELKAAQAETSGQVRDAIGHSLEPVAQYE